MISTKIVPENYSSDISIPSYPEHTGFGFSVPVVI